MTSRDGLDEMRRLLGVLPRTTATAAAAADGCAPAAGLARRSDELVDRRAPRPACRSTVEVEGDRATCPRASTSPPTGSSRRRSPTCSSTPGRPGPRWSSATARDSVTVEVERRRAGRGRRRRRRHAGGGHGLVGMRERVAVFGGDLAAGPRAGGGFRVAATLPFERTDVEPAGTPR